MFVFLDVKNTNVGWLTRVGIPKFLAMILDTQLECEGSEMIRMLSFRRSLVFVRSATGSSHYSNRIFGSGNYDELCNLQIMER